MKYPRNISLVLEVILDENGNFISGTVLPVILKKGGIPFPDDRGRVIELLRELSAGDIDKNPLKIYRDGRIELGGKNEDNKEEK